ncbi:small acid-soluble spore protein Tlp [Shouchella sp. 1P09AA]|uniref:small acid-soluble spore protein Tlp n=1 Tax=unclassified Shouchella TaxID=2893065 RepID=UPI0039A0EADF
MANHDDRSDNAEKIQSMIDDTKRRMHEAEMYQTEHAEELHPDEKRALIEKKRNREISIDALEEEKQEEEGQS